MRYGPWLALLCAAAVAAAPSADDLASRLVDRSGLLPAAVAKQLDARCARLGERGIALAVVVDKDDAASASAHDLLEAWRTAKPDLPAMAGVLRVSLSKQTSELAASPELAVLWPASTTEPILEQVTAALAEREIGGVAAALREACAGLAGERESVAVAAPQAPAALATPPPEWAPAAWYVLCPVLVFAFLVRWREGWRAAVATAPLMAMLCGGLYLMVCFRAGLVVWFGALMAAPLAFLATARPAAPPLRRLGGRLGFGSFGAFGGCRLRRWAWR